MSRVTIAAFLVAACLLVTIVLPAGYGIDPMTVGRGLTEFHPEVGEGGTGAADDELEDIISGNIVAAEPGAQQSYQQPFTSEVATIELESLEEVEFKARMAQGATLLYSWEADQPVYVDLHGEPSDYPKSKAVRYEERDGVPSGHGSVTASFDGLHGWYWLNTNETAVTIRLEVAGYYDSLNEVYRNQQ